MAQMPESVVIGHADFKIDVLDEDIAECTSHEGFIDPERQIIRVRSDPNMNDQTQAEVLLHEILHGCYLYGGLRRDGDDEEQIVTMLARQLCSVMRNSPDVFKWLLKSLKARQSAA